MPIYDIQTPDGKIISIEGTRQPTMGEIKKAYSDYKKVNIKPLTEEQKAKPSVDYSKGVPLAFLTGLGEGGLSGLESYANGYTLGGYDWLNRQFGRNPQDLRDELQQRAESVGWGGANTVGQVASGLGGALRGLPKLTGVVGDKLLGSRAWGLPAMGLSGGADALVQSSFDNDFSSPMQTAIDAAEGGAWGAGMGGLGNVALKPLAKYLSSNAMTKGLKGGLDNVADNPQALRLVNDAVRRNNDIAELYLEATPGALNKVNADTSSLINKALTRKINIPRTIDSQKRKYGEFMKEHGQNQLLNPKSAKQQAKENFNKWFKGSQIVDEAGEPLVVYHGTNADFDAFDPQMIGKATDNGFYGKGFYFTRNKGEASSYGNKVLPSYLKSKNMFDIRGVDGGYYGGLKDNMFEKGANLLDDLGLLDADQVEKYNFYKEAKNNFLKNVDIHEPSDVQDIWFGELTMPDGTKILNRAWESDNTRDGILNVLWNDYARRIKYKDGTYLDHLLDGMSLKDYMRSDGINPQRFSDKLKSMGYDGIYQGDEFVVFEPNQIKSVKNSGGWSKSPSLTDPDWVAEPSVADLFDGLNGFQKKSLASAIKQGSERTNSKLGSLESLNEAKKKLNDMISQAYDDGNRSDVLHLEGVKDRLDNTLGKGLKGRDRPYAKALQMEEAYNKGWEYNPNNVKLKEYTDNLNPLERNAFAQGLFGRMTYNPLMSKNLAKKAMDYDNTLQTVLPKKTYGKLQKGLSKQNTRFERLSRLGKRAETRLQTPEGIRLFLREQTEGTTPKTLGMPAIGAMLDEAIYRGHQVAAKNAAKKLLDPTFEGVKDAWLIENYPTLNAYISGALANEL